MNDDKFYTLTNDKVFKAVFSKENNRDMLEELLYEVTDTRFKVISLLAQELPKSNVHRKGKILDLIAETESVEIVNIELNNSNSEYLHRRNLAYAGEIYANELKVSETYQSMTKVIQINLTNDNKEIPLMIDYTVNNKETGREFVYNFIIYEINIQKAKDTWYNNPKGKRILSLLSCDEEELENAIGDGYVERIKEEVKKLNKDEKYFNFLTVEEDDRLYINSVKQEEYDKGVEQGIEQGLNEKTIEIAKNMLNKGTDIEYISEITGLSIEEIEKLK